MYKELVVFGTSSAEVFDYIFGDNPSYYPFWASGWSARGLREVKESNNIMKPYIPYLSKISKDANIILCFGDVDLDFNLPYKIHNQRFYNFPKFIEEMCEGILALRDYLNKLGFSNIYAALPIAPIRLPDVYWAYPSLPHKTRGNLYLNFVKILSQSIPMIDCFYSLIESVDNPVCAYSFFRNKNDHHIDYVKAQDVIYSNLLEIDGILEQRNPKHTELYVHVPKHIKSILRDNSPRIRTCR
ncbi:TPA: hypothetical protein ACU21O_001637 [Mannheimia haemolytica]